MAFIYKIVSDLEWEDARKSGVFTGAAVDHADGFIHFSTAAQVADTANKHFSGRTGLLLLKVAEEKLGDSLRYEVSRGGALFPHLYGSLPVMLVKDVLPFKADKDGMFSFSELKL